MARKPATLRTRLLGDQLRRLRDENGLTLKEVADHVRRDFSALSRFETGHMVVPEDDLRTLLDLYQVEDDAVRRGIERMRAQALVRGWWVGYADEVKDALVDHVWIESLATGIRTFSATAIYGLLQTEEYARAVISAEKADVSAEQVARWVELRMIRQTILARSDPPTLMAVIDEAALLKPVGGPAVMAAQLRHLNDQSRRPNIEIRVLPLAAAATVGVEGEYHIFDMPEPLEELVCVDGPAGLSYLEPPGTARLVERYARLQHAALDEKKSNGLIEAHASELEEA